MITHPHVPDRASDPPASQRQPQPCPPDANPIHIYATTLDAPGSPTIQVVVIRQISIRICLKSLH